MYSGTLINDLFAAVERVENSARPLQSQNAHSPRHGLRRLNLFLERKVYSPNSSRNRLV